MIRTSKRPLPTPKNEPQTVHAFMATEEDPNRLDDGLQNHPLRAEYERVLHEQRRLDREESEKRFGNAGELVAEAV